MAYKLWVSMSKAGKVDIETLSPERQRIAELMIQFGLVALDKDGWLRQRPQAAQIDRWSRFWAEHQRRSG